MAVVIVLDGQADSAGGGDVIPAAVDWSDIVLSSEDGVESTNAVTFSGINSPIVVRARWTSTSSFPTWAQWVKNGANVQIPRPTPINATVINGDMLLWRTFAAHTNPNGNFDSGTVTVTNESRTATVTITIASPAVVTWTSHGLSAGDRVLFRTTGALPTGLTAETVYFVIAAGLTANAFQVSATSGGAAINTSGAQSGVHTGVSAIDTFAFACQYIPGGGS